MNRMLHGFRAWAVPLAIMLLFLGGAPAGNAQNFPAVRSAPLTQGAALTVRHPAVHWETITVTATSYCLPGHTATGTPVGRGTVAVDPSVIPLGSTVYVQGYGWGRAADTGSAIRGDRVDVWLPPADGCAASWDWGVQTVQVEVLVDG